MDIRKATFLVCLGAAMASSAATLAELRLRARALVRSMTLDEKIGQMVNASCGIPRLGVPDYAYWSEALHGVARNGRATMFPMPIGLACSFNPDLVREMAAAIADEGRVKYVASQRLGRHSNCTGLTFWSPNINIFRDPRWGRGMETWGEDPYLTGSLGAAFVRGLQGDHPVYLKAAACAKHFAVHSGPEALRHSFDVAPSARDLRETYLPAFRTLVVDAKVESVMGAYNRVYGESASASPLLLKDILRSEWGFSGHVVSDCGAVRDICCGHALEESPAAAAARAIRNGLNLECGDIMRKGLRQAVEQGLVTEAQVEDALVPVLVMRFRLGIMGDDPDCPYNNPDPSLLCSPKHAEIARRAARESMVLLKNDGVLPLDLSKQPPILLMGPGATDLFALMGNYYGAGGGFSTYFEGMAERAGAGMYVDFQPGYQYGMEQMSRFGSMGEGPALKATLFAVVGNTGSYEGEEGATFASPLNGDRIDLKLPGCQLDFLREMRRRCTKYKMKLVTLVTGGSPVEMREVLDLSDAVIYVWYAGQEGGRALADLVFGEHDFVGRLPMTFPVSADVLPEFDDYSMDGRTYRYQEAGIELPFGYGLSYARTEYVGVEYAGEAARVTLRNSGTRDASEPVQVYVSSPNAGKGAPFVSLVGFARVSVPAGRTVTTDIPLRPDAFTEIDAEGKTTAPRGAYCVTASAAAPCARSVKLGVKSASCTINR